MKSLFAALLFAVTATCAVAQNTYPNKPVSLLIGYPPGGGVDVVARRLASLMEAKFPAGLVAENRPGAGGTIAVSSIVASPPDGYRLALMPQAMVALSPQVFPLNYKGADDIQPIINIVDYAPVLVVAPDAPFQSMQEFVEAAKAKPNTLSVGYPGDATISHLNLLTLQRETGASFIQIPFKGWGEGAPQLMGGHVTAYVAQAMEAVPALAAGTVRALGSFSAARLSALPQVPTATEQGYPVALGVRYLLIAPKGTPKDIVQYVHDAAKAAIETPEFKAFAQSTSLNIRYQDAETARDAAWEDYYKYRPVLRGLGIVKD